MIIRENGGTRSDIHVALFIFFLNLSKPDMSPSIGASVKILKSCSKHWKWAKILTRFTFKKVNFFFSWTSSFSCYNAIYFGSDLSQLNSLYNLKRNIIE